MLSTRRREAFVALLWVTMGILFLPIVSAFYFATSCNPNDQRFFSRSKTVSENSLSMSSLNINDSTGDSTQIVGELLKLVERKDERGENIDDSIRELITKLSSSAENYIFDDKSPSALFDPLVGYYNVSHTLVSKPNENPVGGKWTRGLWTLKRSMQHILPPLTVTPSLTNRTSQDESSLVSSKSVAQVINIIRLELLWGFVGVWVLLRGDAVPLKVDQLSTKAKDEIGVGASKTKRSPPKLLPNLSDRTVKAYFDPPRIGVSLGSKRKSKTFLRRVLSLGPSSAVVLDTPYADNRVRLGKGGTSGSQFLFTRLPKTDKEATEGWNWVLEGNTKNLGHRLTKKSLILRMGLLGLAFILFCRIVQQRWIKALAGIYAVVSGVSIFGLIRSTGGIETNGDTFMEGK